MARCVWPRISLEGWPTGTRSFRTAAQLFLRHRSSAICSALRQNQQMVFSPSWHLPGMGKDPDRAISQNGKGSRHIPRPRVTSKITCKVNVEVLTPYGASSATDQAKGFLASWRGAGSSPLRRGQSPSKSPALPRETTHSKTAHVGRRRMKQRASPQPAPAPEAKSHHATRPDSCRKRDFWKCSHVKSFSLCPPRQLPVIWTLFFAYRRLAAERFEHFDEPWPLSRIRRILP